MTYTVVHYVDSTILGGSEAVALDLLAGLDRRRWHPILFHRDCPNIDRLLRHVDSLEVSRRAVPAIGANNRATAFREFLRQLGSVNPSVFHAHLNDPLACRYGVMAAKSLAVPAIVATSHLYFSIAGVRFGWIKQRLQCAAIDRYIAVSTAVKRHYCRDLGVPESKVRIVRTGVRDVRFSPSAVDGVRRALSAGGASPIVLTLGRLHDQKGHAHLLRAAALVPDAVFVLAGDGPERRSLETLARSLDVHGRVRFLGYRDDVPDLLAACDLMVLPSLYEGLPISILEAMAAGKPVVATRIGGTDEVVVDEETGLLVPAGDADALAVAIRRVLSDAALASRLGTNGKLRWMQHFSSEAMVREITAIYDELIGTVR